MAESLFFARDDRLQQRNTRISGLDYIKYTCCTGLSAQASMVYCITVYSVLHSTAVCSTVRSSVFT